jgi:hypothetical protein
MRGRSWLDGGWWGRRLCCLDCELVDDGFDAGNLCGIAGGERLRGFAADTALKDGDAGLDEGMDGLGGECGVAGEFCLERGVDGVVIGRRGRFATGEGKRKRKGCKGGEAGRSGEFYEVHSSLSEDSAAKTVNVPRLV